MLAYLVITIWWVIGMCPEVWSKITVSNERMYLIRNCNPIGYMVIKNIVLRYQYLCTTSILYYFQRYETYAIIHTTISRFVDRRFHTHTLKFYLYILKNIWLLRCEISQFLMTADLCINVPRVKHNV